MSTNTSKDSSVIKSLKSIREEPRSASNPAKLVKTPKLPIKHEYSLEQGRNDQSSPNDD